MRWIGWLAAIGACVPPEEAVDAWGEVDGADLLDIAEVPAEAFPDRVLPVHAPRARLLPEGPDLDGVYSVPGELVVVDPTPWPRVAIDTHDVRVLAYVERGALQRRVVAPVDGTGFDGGGRVVIAPSVSVEVVDADDAGRVQVEATTTWLTAWAWLPRHAVDEVYPVDAPEPAPLPEGSGVALLGGAEVLDAPGGEALAVLEDDLMVEQIGEPDGGWVPVVVQRGRISVVGWAFEDDLSRNLWFGRGSSISCGCGGLGVWGAAGGPHATIPAGTWLHAGVDGPVVGVALLDIEVPLQALETGADVRRRTALGEVALWAAPEDLLADGVQAP